MPNCAVFGCSKTSSKSITLHSFPKDPSIRAIWISRCKRADQFNVSKGAVCSSHFTEDSYHRDLESELLNLPTRKARFLKEDAVPTLNLPNSTDPRPRSTGKDRGRRKIVEDIFETQSKRKKVEQSEEQCTPLSVVTVGTNTETSQIELKLRTKISHLRSTIYKQRKVIRSLRLPLKGRKDTKKEQSLIVQKASDLLAGYFSPGQVKCIVEQKRRVRWCEADLKMALTLRHLSRKTYNYLRRFMKIPLPAPSTLSSWSRAFKCYPGVLGDVIEFLRGFLSTFSCMNKLAVLSFDEMSIRRDVVYDKAQDLTLGPYKQVQVCMLRGLVGNWKQPVFFDYDVSMNVELLSQIIFHVEAAGAEVVAIVCDMGSANMKLWRDLGISESRPYVPHFHRNDAQLHFFADIPHALKLLRNHILDEGLRCKGVTLNKVLFHELLELDSHELKLCPKITTDYVNLRGAKRMQVRPAAQLL